MGTTITYLPDKTGGDTDIEILHSYDASIKDVEFLLNQPITDNGRSKWKWLRLPTGELILGVYPLGDTYEELQHGRLV